MKLFLVCPDFNDPIIPCLTSDIALRILVLLFPCRSDTRQEEEEEEEEEEILGSDDDEQEDPKDYVKGE